MFNIRIVASAVLTSLVIAVSNWRADININLFFCKVILGRLASEIRNRLESS